MVSDNRRARGYRFRCRGRSDAQWDNLFSKKTDVFAIDEKRSDRSLSGGRLHQGGRSTARPFDTERS